MKQMCTSCLKPVDEWTTAHTKEDFIQKLADRLERIPGVAYNFTQPMAMRLDEVVSGIKADVAVKIFGEDTAFSNSSGSSAQDPGDVPGAADAQAEIISGVAELRVQRDRTARALWPECVGRTGDCRIDNRRTASFGDGRRTAEISDRGSTAGTLSHRSGAMGNLLLQSPGASAFA